MIIKSDFVTNSSSTNYIVIDTWEVTDGNIEISNNFNSDPTAFDITKKFIDYIYNITQFKVVPNFSISKNYDHLQLGFEEADDDFVEYEFNYKEPDINDPEKMVKRIVYLWESDFTMNIYNNKSIKVSFNYKTAQSADEVRQAINQMIRDLVKILGLSKIKIEGERAVVDFVGDGWDGGDPWCGNYGETEECKEEVNGKYELTIG